jgi:hypothetical protein
MRLPIETGAGDRAHERRGETSVDGDVCAGDVAGPIAREEDHDIRDVIGTRDSA